MKNKVLFKNSLLVYLIVFLIWTILINISLTFFLLRKYKIVEKQLDIKYVYLWEEKKDNFYDLKLDDSITKFVNNKVHFENLSYVPSDLESISWMKYVIDAKWNWFLRKEAKDNLEKMSLDLYNNFKEEIVVVSSYRSYTYQKWIKDRWCPDNLCAKAWYSEHQSWLAMDLWEATTQKQFLSNQKYEKYFEWLNDNAYKYWFTNTYQKWLEVDWYEIEPWHRRYVWKKIAEDLKIENITFAEFYNNALESCLSGR